MTKITGRDLLRLLIGLFRNHGFDGSSLSVLAEGTGLGRASLYHLYPGGKEAMAEAVYARGGPDLPRPLLPPPAASAAPAERLRRMAEGLDAFYNGGRNACLVDVFTIGGANPLFADAVSGAVDYWAASIVRVLEDAGLTRSQAQQRAEDAIIEVEGALVLARATGRLEPFTRTIERLPGRLIASA